MAADTSGVNKSEQLGTRTSTSILKKNLNTRKDKETRVKQYSPVSLASKQFMQSYVYKLITYHPLAERGRLLSMEGFPMRLNRDTVIELLVFHFHNYAGARTESGCTAFSAVQYSVASWYQQVASQYHNNSPLGGKQFIGVVCASAR